QLGQLRPERRAQAGRLDGGIAQRHRPPPRAAADEPRGERELPGEPARALGPAEERVDERAERTAQRELVVDRLRKPEALDTRRGERGEPACGSAGAHVPGRADGGERPLERALEPTVEPLDSGSLEVDAPRLGRLDREPRVLEPAQVVLPRLLRPRGILLYE